jgi:hypothetical protein
MAVNFSSRYEICSVNHNYLGSESIVLLTRQCKLCRRESVAFVAVMLSKDSASCDNKKKQAMYDSALLPSRAVFSASRRWHPLKRGSRNDGVAHKQRVTFSFHLPDPLSPKALVVQSFKAT